ncbi:hypothetical protein KIN20_019191 [Parelaphostrongylus tenuis]|uniref:Uncharacterized protein n=1 Tax=Parelaphostrongylus tenuis TaxID=148309 RepID=A0AAD5QSS2_PARTN|nr:hypothetical protein KIN20_019191 [Parelaphostrongylus tenuis]
MATDRISEAYKSPIKRGSQVESRETPSYATSKTFSEQKKSQRTRAADADSGIQPTKWQRRFLVLTGLYRRQSDIPQYVASGTMNRMHDRMRVVFIVVAVSVFCVIFFSGEITTHRRIIRDREAGVDVKKTNTPLNQRVNMDIFRKVFMIDTHVEAPLNSSTIIAKEFTDVPKSRVLTRLLCRLEDCWISQYKRMLACAAERPVSLIFASYFLPKFLPKRMASDRISQAYRSPIKRDSQLEPKETPSYATSSTFSEHRKSQRTRAADADSGVQPTKWQRRFLVLTRLYRNQSDIPQYVAIGTMNRMHDRLRVVFILVGVTVFSAIFFAAEFGTHHRIIRDRDAGVNVKKLPTAHFGNFHRVGDETCTLSDQIGQFNTTFGCYTIGHVISWRDHMDIFRKVLMSDTHFQAPRKGRDKWDEHPTPEQEAKIIEESGKHTGEPRKGTEQWQKQNLTPGKKRGLQDSEGKTSGVPIIPNDVGHTSGKETGGAKKTGVIFQPGSHTGVYLGLGLTTLALLGMFKVGTFYDNLEENG